MGKGYKFSTCQDSMKQNCTKTLNIETVETLLEPDAQARKCEYFRAVSPRLTEGPYVIIGLLNPRDSEVLMHAYASAVSNFTNEYNVEYLLLNPKFDMTSLEYFNAMGTNLSSCRKSKGLFVYDQGLKSMPTDTPNIISESIVQPLATLTTELLGEIIIPPGKIFVIAVRSADFNSINAALSIGWWESKCECK